MSRTSTGKRRAEERRAAHKAGEIHPDSEKWCQMCDKVKPFTDFYIRYDYNGLLSQYCKVCHMKDCKVRKQIKKRMNAQST